MAQRKYGWRPDLPDYRDLVFTGFQLLSLPPKVDLREACPLVYDQMNVGSCTANAIGAAFQFDEMKQQVSRVFTPSRLFIYYNERVIERCVQYDNGAEIRNGFKALTKWGVCDEQLWPYIESDFAREPPQEIYDTAKRFLVPNQRYARLPQQLDALKQCLAGGIPFVFGFSVYDNFESDELARTGMMGMPNSGESMLGGHAVLAVGYDDALSCFIIRNSWGSDWGLGGYFMMPYDYVVNSDLASDFWALYSIETFAQMRNIV